MGSNTRFQVDPISLIQLNTLSRKGSEVGGFCKDLLMPYDFVSLRGPNRIWVRSFGESW